MADLDEVFMKIALEEAEESYKRGYFPVGAVLVSNGKIIGQGNNSNATDKGWSSHAENVLIKRYSADIKELIKSGYSVDIYTTLEPCLMCLGTIVLNRISRVIYACPDPNGGATKLDPASLSAWYKKKWPVIERGVLKEESYQLLVNYMEKYDRWENLLAQFQAMHLQ
jgi:tRNA(adenine34) deaminase